MYHLACSVQPCGLAPEDSIHAAVSAAAGQQCFWWIQENRPKNSGILKVRIDAACFGASGGSSSISSVFSIRSPPGCTLRDVTAAIALKVAAQGYVPLAAADSSIIVCACLPHPHLPPAMASHVITGTGSALDMPVDDVLARLGPNCLWSVRRRMGGADAQPLALPIALPLPLTLRLHNVTIAGEQHPPTPAPTAAVTLVARPPRAMLLALRLCACAM